MMNELYRFIVTLDEGSITRAAKKLHLTQPALSISLKKLEKELNTQLFITKQRQMKITESGEHVYRVAKKIVELWTTAKNNLIHTTHTPISLGLFDNAALLLAKFLQQQQYNITIDRSANLIKDIFYGLIDIAVIVKHPEEKIDEFTIVEEIYEQLIPVGSSIYTTDLKQIPFILYNENSQTRKCIDTIFLSHGINPTIAVSSSSTTFMKELAMQGGGVALLPKNFIQEEIKTKKLFIQKIPITFSRTIAIVIKKNANEEILKHAEQIVKKLLA